MLAARSGQQKHNNYRDIHFFPSVFFSTEQILYRKISSHKYTRKAGRNSAVLTNITLMENGKLLGRV